MVYSFVFNYISSHHQIGRGLCTARQHENTKADRKDAAEALNAKKNALMYWVIFLCVCLLYVHVCMYVQYLIL